MTLTDGKVLGLSVERLVLTPLTDGRFPLTDRLLTSFDGEGEGGRKTAKTCKKNSLHIKPTFLPTTSAHPVSVLILHLREIQIMWST